MKKASFLVTLTALVFVLKVLADGSGKAPDAGAEFAIKVNDNAALTEAGDKEITVTGTVSSAAWIPSGAVFLIKFKDSDASQFQGVVFAKNKKDLEAAFKGDLSAALNGATIQIKGKVKMYREHPEIVVSDASQITTLAKGTGKAPSAPSTSNAIKLYGIYQKLTMTDEQKMKVAAIQKDAYDAEKAVEVRLAKEADEKIAVLLSDDQKKQLSSLKHQASSPRKDDGD